MLDYDRSLSELFESTAEVHRDRLAYLDHSVSLTYEELNQRANALARELIGRYPDEEQIAVFMKQGYTHIIHLLAIIKAGKVYVPVNTSVPTAKIGLILEQYDCRVLLTNFERLKELEQSLREIQISTYEDMVLSHSTSNLSLPISPKNRVLIISTSGTTGKPKGVIHSHESMLHSLRNYEKLYQIDPDDVHSLFYPIGFFANIRDILVSLLTGASLKHLSVVESRVDLVKDWIVDQGITILSCPIGLFRKMSRTLPDGFIFDSVRILRMGADAHLKSDFELFKRHFSKSAKFISALASSETGLIRVNVLEHDTVLTGNIVPTGYAVDGMEIHLIDDEGEAILDDSVTGRIVVEGDYLALGYENMPELTAESFKLNARTGRRYFTTNDLGHFEHGCLHFDGRLEFHVKTSGYRVDLNEIQYVAFLRSEIDDAAVIYHDELNCLYLFYVLTPNSQLGTDELRNHLVQYLPRYMIPARCIEMNEFPSTAGGKIDRRRLYGHIHDLCHDDDAPRTETEEKIWNIWRAHFKKNSISISDNFFELGGDSIIAVHLICDIEAEFGISVRDNIVYEFPEIHSMAKAIDERCLDSRFQWVKKLKSGDGSAPPLFWFIMPDQILFRAVSSNQATYLVPGHYSRFAEIPIEQSFHEIVESVCDEIVRVEDSETVVLGGYSIGAIFALEVARRLPTAGKKVNFIFLLDPNTRIGGNIDWIERPLKRRFRRKRRSLKRILRYKRRAMYIKYCKLFNKRISQRDRIEYVREKYVDLRRNLKLEPYTGRVILVHREGEDAELWRRLVKQDSLRLVTGNYEAHTAFIRDEAAMGQWSSALNRALDER